MPHAAPLPSVPGHTETSIEPASFSQRQNHRWGCDFSRLAAPPRTRAFARRAIALQEENMRLIANYLATTSLVLVTAFAAMPAWAADLDATSSIDTVIVYPDGASVTQIGRAH